MGKILGFGFLGLFVLGIVTCIAAYVSYANQGNALEKGIIAQYDSNRNTLSNYTSKVKETAQLTKMAKEDLVEVMTKTLDARYGEEGSKALFQMIREQNGTVDPALYTKIQQIIDAGRTEFKTSQDALLDRKRVYETLLDNVWSGFWLRNMAGYPKIDLKKYDIVVLGSVNTIFETKEDQTIQLR